MVDSSCLGGECTQYSDIFKSSTTSWSIRGNLIFKHILHSISICPSIYPILITHIICIYIYMSHLQILSHLYIIRSQEFPGYPIINSIWLYIPWYIYIYIMINPISVYDILSSVYQYIHIISIYHGRFISIWYTVCPMTSHLPSGTRLHNYGKSPFYSWEIHELNGDFP